MCVCTYYRYVMYIYIMVHCTMNEAVPVGYTYTGTLGWVHVCMYRLVVDVLDTGSCYIKPFSSLFSHRMK